MGRQQGWNGIQPEVFVPDVVIIIEMVPDTHVHTFIHPPAYDLMNLDVIKQHREGEVVFRHVFPQPADGRRDISRIRSVGPQPVGRLTVDVKAKIALEEEDVVFGVEVGLDEGEQLVFTGIGHGEACPRDVRVFPGTKAPTQRSSDPRNETVGGIGTDVRQDQGAQFPGRFGRLILFMEEVSYRFLWTFDAKEGILLRERPDLLEISPDREEQNQGKKKV